jgi:hypothetical protein
MTKARVKDNSNDRSYFTITPRLVWAICEDPDEYTLWCVIKDIAGEDGQCILAREDLATLAMMSTGRVSECRDNLLKKKLLEGELRRDPGYPQSVWHLFIPDIWEANTRWARKYPKIADRIGYKKDQAESLKAIKKEASQGDGSKKASQGDGGTPPRDGGMSPGDTKKKVLEIHKEEMINNPMLLWEQVQEAIRSNLKRNNQTFLAGAQPISFSDGVLILVVRDQMTRDWLDDHLTATINRTFPGLIEREAAVQFVVETA